MTQVPTPDASVKPRHFACFDGLRAIAAVSVLLLHTAWVSGFTTRSSFGIYSSRLEIGVSVFFLISGFLLYRPFAVSHLANRPAPVAKRFWGRRLLRIVPAYWLALLVLTYVLGAVNLGNGWQEVVIHLLFLQIYFPKAVFFGIPQAWSLCTEMSFYLFLPLYAAFVARRKRTQERQMRTEIVGIVTLVVISMAFRVWVVSIPVTKFVNGQRVGVCYPHCLTQAPFSRLLLNWLPSYLDLFAFGMLLAVLSAWWSERDSEPLWLSRRWVPWASWIGALGAFWVVSHLGISPSPLYLIPGGTDLERQELYGLFAFLLLVPAVVGPQDQTLIRKVLRFWPIASLGVISYGIYLWHLNLIDKFLSWTGLTAGQVPFWELALGVLAITTVIASASYFGLERPMLRIKGKLGWWNRSTARVDGPDDVLAK